MDKTLKETIRSEYNKAWSDDSKMRDYCTNKVSKAAVLSGGKIVIFEKQKIKTDFCFGYSLSRYDSEDYDNANNLAHHAATNEEYFKRENLRDYDKYIAILEGTGDSTWKPFIEQKSYYGETEPLKIYELTYMYYSKYLEAKNNERLTPFDELPEEDQAVIIETYKAERNAQEKKVNTYLKRYGLSKVHSWSYWQDE